MANHDALEATPILRVADVSKTYPGVRALQHVDLEVLPGEIHAVIGENGAGKSTPMKIVPPGHGNVHWDEVFRGLAAIAYHGPLVLESFAAMNPDLAGATCVWRTPSYTSDQLAREGMAFLRDRAAASGLS